MKSIYSKNYKIKKLKELEKKYKYFYFFNYNNLTNNDIIIIKKNLKKLNSNFIILKQKLIKKNSILLNYGSIFLVYSNDFIDIFSILKKQKQLEFSFLKIENNFYSHKKLKHIISNKNNINISIIKPIIIFLNILKQKANIT